MTGKNKLIDKLHRKYPKKIFSYDNVFFTYKCDVLNDKELNLINQANEKIKNSIVSYIKETQEGINDYINQEDITNNITCYRHIDTLSNEKISKLYFENNIHLFPELTLNAQSYCA